MVEKQKKPRSVKKTSTPKKAAAKKAPVKKASASKASKEKISTQVETPAEHMQFIAKARYIWYSPYKLRMLADVVRGKDVNYALSWLKTYRTQRSVPIKKIIESAVANAKNKSNVDTSALTIKEIKVDQGPIHRYFKPGAMGRAMVQRKRLSHVSVILETKS